MHTKTELLALLKAQGLRLSKRLGQSYLVDSAMIRRLVDTCRLTPGDVVVEIGAGLGALTQSLTQQAGRVIAVEIDRGIFGLLQQRLRDCPNVELRCEDILQFDWAAAQPTKVIGMIPYQITSPILVSLCERREDLGEIWLGVQREVAQRLDAAPGTKAYGRLTVLVQYYYRVETLFKIPKTVFFPVPDVDSAWVKLTPRQAPVAAGTDTALLFAVVKAAFEQRRKTLVNSIQACLPGTTREQASAAVQAAGLAPRVRGEELSIDEFAALARALAFAAQPRLE